MSDDALPDAVPTFQDSAPAPAPDKRRSFLQWLAIPAVPVVWLWRRRPVILSSLDDLRRYSVNIVILFAIVLLGYATWRATFESLIVVEPIAIPKSLQDHGYTAATVAQRLIDQVHVINDAASTKKGRTAIGSESHFASLASLQLPAAGFSFRSLISTLRNLLGVTDSKIGGEILATSSDEKKRPDSESYVLLLRVEHRGTRTVRKIAGSGIDDLMAKAAQPAVEILDPYVLVAYHYATYDWRKAEPLAELVSLTAEKDTAKWALLIRGHLRARRGDPAGAIAFYKEAIALDALFMLAYTTWAYALMEDNKPDEAIKVLETAETINSKSASIYIGWGDALLVLKKPAEAMKKFERALRIDPKGNYALIGIASALQAQNKDGEARKKCWAAQIVYRSPEAYFSCGLMYDRMGDTEAALDAFRKAATLQPRHLYAHIAIGSIHANKKEFAAAADRYKRAMEIDPGNVMVLMAWGTLYALMNAFNEAIEQLEAANRVSPRPHLDSWIQQVKVYRDRGGAP